MASLNERFLRMSPAARGITLLLSITLALFVIAFWAGFMMATIEHGHLPRKPRGWVVIVVGAIATVGLVQLLRVLFKGDTFAGMTGFDRRYWKMWLLVGLLGMPIGIGMVLLGGIDTPGDVMRLFGGDPIGPAAAVAATAVLILTLGVAAWLYHRAIDDHEERAYLWGSQIAYYFLALAVPVWWLLSRGNLIPPLDFTAAFSLILVSFVIQGSVWAWFKFR